MPQQLISWLNYKYRTRRVCYRNEENRNGNGKKTITEIRTPDKKESDLVFAVYQNTKTPSSDSFYKGN